MYQLSPEAMQKMEEMQRAYLDGLPQKKEAISNAAKDFFDSQGSSNSYAQLKSLLHQLAGSAGMYGLQALGEIAREGDQLLAQKAEFSVIEAELSSLLIKLDEYQAEKST